MTLFNALYCPTVIGIGRFGIKNVTPSEQGGVVKEPAYTKLFNDEFVSAVITGVRSISPIVMFVPRTVTFGRPATIESINGSPSPMVSWNTTARTRIEDELSIIISFLFRKDTSILVDDVHLHRKIFIVEAMFGGSVKVKLNQVESLIGEYCGSIVHHFQCCSNI